MLRPSTKTALRMRRRGLGPVDARGARGHSVTSTAASAPASAAALDVRDLDAVEGPSAVGDRIPRADVGALGEQPAREHEARRLAHVVGVGLEGEPEQRDRLARAASRGAAAASRSRGASAARSPRSPRSAAGSGSPSSPRAASARASPSGSSEPPNPIPARRNAGPIRWSRPIPSATVMTSAPDASQTFAISLMKRDPRDEGGVRGELDHLRRGDVAADDRRLDPRVEPLDDVAVGLVEGADDDPVRVHEVAHRRALGGELRVRDVADVREARARRAGAGRLRPCRRGPCSSSRRRPAGRPAAARRPPSRRRRGRRRRSTSAACRPRRRRTRPRRSPPRRPS